VTTEDDVYMQRDGEVVCVVLNRPQKLNALTHPMIGAVRDAVGRAQNDPSVKVVLLRGEGRAFCVGDDLADLSSAAAQADRQDALVAVLQDVTRQIMAGPKPVIAVVQGWAIGAAFSWMLNCDHVICARSATAFFPELKWGVSPTGAATALAPRILGVAGARKAFQLLQRFTADDLLALGAVTRVVDDGEELATALALARDLAARSPAALQGVKQLTNRFLVDRLDEVLLMEARLAVAMATGAEVSGRIEDFLQSNAR
jgi:enoyl-CoA hydratase/carnithine racemase